MEQTKGWFEGLKAEQLGWRTGPERWLKRVALQQKRWNRDLVDWALQLML